MSNVLEVTGLTTQVNSKGKHMNVIDNLSFTIKKGESLGIVGESGCGKSMVVLSLMQLLDENVKVIEGNISLDGKDLLQLSDQELRNVRGKEMAMIFQDPMTSINPVLKIGKQIREAVEKDESVSRSERDDRVIDLLKQVGIPRPNEIVREYPHRLSGGMRQRVMIAMAIACHPTLLIADEPTTALDVTIQAQILDLLKKIRSDTGMSLIMITHDLGIVSEVCDRVMVMYAGQVVETTDVRTLLLDPKHPYTIGLINSMPQKARGLKRLNSIPGNVPTPGDYPSGCRFAARCDNVMPICLEKSPELINIDEQTSCRCWLYSDNKEVQGEYGITDIRNQRVE
ncbi:ABC transporter ATP-binding protein [Cytobacillus sp. FJAT-53684]|uniref:ABC transporter ATP-binding protein n=1 Tax=Cytobacillus mangrovibacter TaxID=3299024 RepID=A0ABW6JW66_9BACI